MILIGAGRHALVLAEKIIESAELRFCGFIDKKSVSLPEFITKMGYLILGEDDVLGKYKDTAYFHLAIGGQLLSVRKKLIKTIKELQLRSISIIHSTAYVAASAEIGEGVAILTNAVVNTSAKIGSFCCINTGAIVEHDCKIGHNVFIQPRCVLAGNVTVGDNTVVGIGASVREGIAIGADCIIGGGSFVCKDIPDNSVAYGVPAKIVSKNEFDNV